MKKIKMKDKTKEKWRIFFEGLGYFFFLLGIGIGGAIASVIAFVVGTSPIWLPTMLIIFAIKGII